MYHRRILYTSYIFTLFTFNEILFSSAASTATATDIITTLPPEAVATSSLDGATANTDAVQTTVMSSEPLTTLTSSTSSFPSTEGPLSIECETNTCPFLREPRPDGGTPMCLKRQAPTGPNFVCECPSITRSDFGFECEDRYILDFQNSEPLRTCYGSECRTGSTASNNFPKTYNRRFGGTMTLVYVPGAFRFDLSFDNIFEIELFKDDLVVGPGLRPSFDQIPGPVDQKNNLKNAKYFNGFTKPNDFSVDGDTMWVWFGYDNSISYRGFNLSWTSVAIDIDCPDGQLRKSLPDESDQIVVKETYPPTQYGVAEEYITVVSTFPRDEFLFKGTYDVQYKVSDNFGNAESCDYQLIVEDTTRPDVVFCPEDYELIGVCGTDDANLTEPMAFDNVDGEIFAILKAGPLGEGNNNIEYSFTDSSDNVAFCRVTVGIYCMPPTKAPQTEFPLWIVFVAAAVAVGILLLILAVFANAKLSAIKAAHQADLSFNPEEFTGHKPGAPLVEAPPPPSNEKIGMYEIQA